MLAKSPRDRYEDLGVVAHELSAVCTGSDRALEPKQPKPKKPMPTFSMTRLNLALVLVLTNALAIGLTIAVTNLSFWQQTRASTAPQRQQEAHKSSPLRHAPPADPVGNAIVNGLSSESNWTSQDEPSSPSEAQAPPEYQPPIISTIVTKGGMKMREFKFPKSPIGMVTTLWEGILSSQSKSKSAPISGVADSTQDYPIDVPLTLDISLLKFPDLIKHSDVYAKIGANEFAGLMLNGCPLSDEDRSKQEQTFLRDVLQQAAKWKSLQGLGLRYFDFGAEDAAAIDKLGSLQVFEMDDSTFADDQALKNSQFLRRVHYIFGHAVKTEELARAAQGSKNLNAVAFNKCDCSAKTFEYLRDCPIQKITISQPNISDDLIKEIASLHGAILENIGSPDMTAAQVKVLLHSSTLKCLWVSHETMQLARAAGIVDPRLLEKPTAKENNTVIQDFAPTR
jgi:hypothetical protein